VKKNRKHDGQMFGDVKLPALRRGASPIFPLTLPPGERSFMKMPFNPAPPGKAFWHVLAIKKAEPVMALPLMIPNTC
jgi:hypothetical protein